MSNASEFIKDFTALESWMTNKLNSKEHETFHTTVYKLGIENRQIRQYSSILRRMGDLRNAIVHSDRYPEFIIAEPNEETVNEFKQISELIMQPPALLTFCGRNPSSVALNTPLPEILSLMSTKDYSQILVQKENTYHLLSREAISKWLESNITSDIISIKDTTAEDILKHGDPRACRFVGKNIDVFEFVDIITSAQKAIQAVVVTQNGKDTEKPLGIATIWDAGVILATLGSS